MTKKVIIEKQTFVLAPDFAAKLFAMHTRLTAGYNVILYGDTVRIRGGKKEESKGRWGEEM
jgi:hypothetical protein